MMGAPHRRIMIEYSQKDDGHCRSAAWICRPLYLRTSLGSSREKDAIFNPRISAGCLSRLQPLILRLIPISPSRPDPKKSRLAGSGTTWEYTRSAR